MSANSFGRLFRLTSYGESHGVGLGGIIDGCPPNLPLSESLIQEALDRRRPGQGGPTATPRKEPDTVRLLSGVFEGKSTGTPIAFHIENSNQHSSDYDALRDIYRPGHADFTYDKKYGIRDHRGGGRSSGRETVARVAGGAIAQAFLAQQGIAVHACTVELGGIPAARIDAAGAHSRLFFAGDDAVIPLWEQAALQAKAEGDTLGGLVRVEAHGVPAGLGEPVFDKLDALFAHALMSVGAVKGVEVGAGFSVAASRGSRNNDTLTPQGFASNNSGGILGGISTGDPIVLTAAVKPIASIQQQQMTVNTRGEATPITIGGRHDISAIPRIVPVLQAMVALVLADAWLIQQARS